MTSAAQAVAAYDFPAALALYDQALAQPGLTPETEYELRRQRTVCYERLGRLTDWMADLAAMLALAEDLGDPARQARALAGQAIALGFLGSEEAGGRAGERALALARELGDGGLEAEALFARSATPFFQGQLVEVQQLLTECLPLARAAGLRSVETMALGRLALAILFQGGTDAATKLAQQALALAREDGDRRLEGQAFTTLRFMTPDLVVRRNYGELALARATAVGDLPRQRAAYNNLALDYLDLGLYRKAQRYARHAVAGGRAMGSPSTLSTFLNTLGR